MSATISTRDEKYPKGPDGTCKHCGGPIGSRLLVGVPVWHHDNSNGWYAGKPMTCDAEPLLKYAILSPADQTIVYQMEDGNFTCDHKEAMLWDHPWDVEIECDRLNNEFIQAMIGPLDDHGLELQRVLGKDPRDFWRWSLNDTDGISYIIEEVKDETEFRSREDTW